MKKSTIYILIIFLIIPPTLFLKPKPANAYILLAARAVLGMAVRAGVPKFLSSGYTMALKPVAGKLYNLKLKNWIAFTASASVHLALASLIPFNKIDTSLQQCTSYKITMYYMQAGGVYSASRADDAVAQLLLQIGFPTGTYSIGKSLGVDMQEIVEGSIPVGDIMCVNKTGQNTTAYDSFMVDVINAPIPPSANEINTISSSIFKSVQDALKDPTIQISTDPNANGLVLEEVQNQTYKDSNGVTHNITRDSTTGKLLDNGVPLPDEIIITDVNGVQHRFSIDSVTGNVLDNTNPVGNFAQWTDSEGNVHTVTVDPVTGKLMDNTKAWNPDTIPTTASNPSSSSGTTSSTTTASQVVDPVTGLTSTVTTTTGTSSTDFTPLINSNAKALVEQKKTTDSVNKLNKTMNDVYTAISNNSTSQAQMVADKASINTQLSSIRAKEAGNNFLGIGGFISRVKLSPIYNSMSNALIVNGAVGYPSWGTVQTFDIMGSPFTIDATLNTVDYAWIFDAMRSVMLLGAAWFAFRRIFG